jgi:putative tryptophan/tyrosine transport system substrate-binding protein
MRRREFVTMLGTSAVAWPLAGKAQVAGKVWRIGIVFTNSLATYSSNHVAFLQGMRDLGYVEGKDFVVENPYG